MKLLNTITASAAVALLALLGSGCSDDTTTENPSTEPLTKGDATLTLTIGKAETKSAQDGDIMNRLAILLVSTNSTIVGRSITTPAAASATVTFPNVMRGSYTLYIVANAPTDIDFSQSAYAVGATLPTTLVDQQLSTLTGTNIPSYTDAQGMPLSLIKSVALVSGDNSVSAELERVTGRFNIQVYNHIPTKTVGISNVTLSNFNANTGYLFSHSYVPPATVTYRGFPPFTTSSIIPSYGNAAVLSGYLYENAAPAYTVDITGALLNASDNPTSYAVVKSAGANIGSTSGLTTASTYFLRSYSGTTYYMYMDASGNMGVTSFASDAALTANPDYKNFLWQFANESTGIITGRIMNVGTGRYITLSGGTLGSTATASSATTLYTGNFTTYSTLYFRQGTTGTRYFISRNGSTLNTLSRNNTQPSSSNSAWYAREFSQSSAWVNAGGTTLTPVKEFTVSKQITYINSFGAAAALTRIARNDQINMKVNIYYSESSGVLDFEVATWIKKTGDITFE